MTREEMSEWLEKHGHIERRGNKLFQSSYAQGCDDGYEFAEENFESRTCENCKYRQTNHAGDMFWCINQDGANKYRTMDIRIDLDFGCNKWENKDV